MSSGFIFRPKKKVPTEEEKIAAIIKKELANDDPDFSFEMRKTTEYLQYRVNGGDWVNAVASSELGGVTKSAVEDVLTGEITTHTHPSSGLSQAQILTRQL